MTLGGDDWLAWAFGEGIERARDVSGRALGEHAVSPIPASEQARLRFSDPRDDAGVASNVAALKQVTSHWSSILHRLRPQEAGWRGMLHACRRPWAELVLAHANGGALEAEVAAAYKVAQGFAMFIRSELLLGGHDAPIPDHRELLARLDRDRWLVGDVFVCPASRRQIAEVWCVLLGESPDAFVDSPELSVSTSPAAARVQVALGRLESALHALAGACGAATDRGAELDAFLGERGRLGVHLESIDRLDHALIDAHRLSPVQGESHRFHGAGDFVRFANDVLEGLLSNPITPRALTMLRHRSAE